MVRRGLETTYGQSLSKTATFNNNCRLQPRNIRGFSLRSSLSWKHLNPRALADLETEGCLAAYKMLATLLPAGNPHSPYHSSNTSGVFLQTLLCVPITERLSETVFSLKPTPEYWLHYCWYYWQENGIPMTVFSPWPPWQRPRVWQLVPHPEEIGLSQC